VVVVLVGVVVGMGHLFSPEDGVRKDPPLEVVDASTKAAETNREFSVFWGQSTGRQFFRQFRTSSWTRLARGLPDGLFSNKKFQFG
jgi:hypothetical protein